MFQTLISFLQSVPFFHFTSFGILAMILVGSSWCLVGLVMGDAPKKGIDPALVQLCGGLFSVVIGSLIMVATHSYSSAPAAVTCWTLLTYFISGAVNFAMLQTMAAAMQRGPNGVVWGIIQSSLVFPFIVGVSVFGVALSGPRLAGIILLLLALIFFASAKNNAAKTPRSKGLNWKIIALIGMVLAATQQNLSTAPSYFESARGVSSIMRSIASAAGTLVAAIIFTLARLTPELKTKLLFGIKNPVLWKYIFALQTFSLLTSYLLLYPGIDVMADHGLGGMCYPMMIGSCIVAFTLLSAWLLKEKISRMQIAALVACVLGLAAICLPASVSFSTLFQRIVTIILTADWKIMSDCIKFASSSR